jgi:glycosyltransferase involved in cell wall biosynthesis
VVVREADVVKLSLVVPCYNEEAALPQTAARLDALLDDLVVRGKVAPASDVLLVDDGSQDATWALIAGLADRSPRFVGVKLSRNRGHQNALLAGLMQADGDAVISLDADLQDDLGVIEQMVDAFNDGCEIVYGVRNHRDADTWFKRWTAERYYGLLRALGVDIVPNHADYRLLGRRALAALQSYEEVNLFLRGVIPQLGFRSQHVFYERGERVAGESKYPLSTMLGLAVDGVTSFSAVPLRLIAGLGAVVFVLSGAIALRVLGVRLFTDRAVPGWASTLLPIYALGGVQLLSIGVVGEYVAKIYLETKRRPRFFIEQIARRVDGAVSLQPQDPARRDSGSST